MPHTDRKHASRGPQVLEICKECGRTLSEPHLPGLADVPNSVGRAPANLRRLVDSLSGFREADLLHAAQTNLQALLQIAEQRTSKRRQ
jgi:hypothetical protein